MPPPQSYEDSSFQGHKISVETQDDIIPALHTIWSDIRVAIATHNIYAYRIKGVGSKVVEHYEDDGEWGAGRRLLTVLQEKDITNTLVCVTRWCGKKLLGPSRFTHIVDAANEVLEPNTAQQDLQSETYF